MINSSTEMLGLVGELFTRRAPMVCGKEAKRQGIPLKTIMDRWPKHLKLGWATVVALHARYCRGDYRHDAADVGVLEAFCNYLIETHQGANGHPVRPVRYDPRTMQARQRLAETPDIYAQVLMALKEQFG